MKAIRDFLELIKFEHTIFALPFAYMGMLLAAGGLPTLHQFVWITVAMAAARTLAMGVNRLVDRHLDAQNPRTDQRPLVTGSISLRTARVGTLVSAGVLVFAAAMLGAVPLILLPLAALFLVGYSYTKRFTWMSHFILGFTDGLAPVGAWVAVTGSLFTARDLPAWILLAVVTLWIGGFDLLYACQDCEVDQRLRLHSIPARFGVRAALVLSALSHALMMLLLVGLGWVMGMRGAYWLAVVVSAALLVWEHSLVHPNDLSHIDLAFFNINSYISLTLFAGILGSIFF